MLVPDYSQPRTTRVNKLSPFLTILLAKAIVEISQGYGMANANFTTL
jgi:hypothetical protein